jgi:NADH-ubiquinone oxidoreductase chain 5
MFYNKYITNLVLHLGGQTTKVLDRGCLELIGPFGAERLLINLSKSLNALSTGAVTSYALYILIGFIQFILIIYLPAEIKPNIVILVILLASFSLSDSKANLASSVEGLPSSHDLKSRKLPRPV